MDVRPQSYRAVAPAGEVPVLAVAMLFPTFATWCYFTLLGGSAESRPVFVVAKLAQFALPLVWFRWAAGERGASFSRCSLRDTCWGLAFGGAVAGAIAIGYWFLLRNAPLLSTAPRAIAEKLTGFGIRHAWQYAAMALFYTTIHSLLEEYYWRWFVFGHLRRHVPIAIAIAVSSLAFMAHHVLLVGHFLHGFGPATWALSGCVAIGGAVWACLYARTGALYAPWISHAAIDAALMAVGYDLWRQAL